jgi:hypothetical protein
MKEQLEKDLDNVIASGNTKISGLEVIDQEVKVYLQSDIFSNHGEISEGMPEVMIKMNKEGKVSSNFSSFDFDDIKHLDFRTQLRGVSDFFENVSKVFDYFENNKYELKNSMKKDENLRSNIRRLRP